MKTLGEVIRAYEICTSNKSCVDECPYYKNDCPAYTMEKDALHYLKEYQITQMAYIKAMADLEDNPSLSWDELKQLEGKPVWVEIGLLRPRWFLIEGFNGDQMIGVDALSVRVPFYEDAFYTGGCKAYRKERG